MKAHPPRHRLSLQRLLGAVGTLSPGIACSVLAVRDFSTGSALHQSTLFQIAVIVSSLGATIGLLRGGSEGMVHGLIVGLIAGTVGLALIAVCLFAFYILWSGGLLPVPN